MKTLLISLIVLLSACTTVPVKTPFPEAPETLMEKPKSLFPIKLEDRDHIALSEMMTVVIQNYGICHQNSVKYEAWQVWYTKQKELYNQAN